MSEAQEKVSFWRSPLLSQPGIVHGFSNRWGGVSPAPFDSLNLGLHVGDNPDAVRENRRRAALSLGFDLERMVCAEQVHGSSVAFVTEADAGRESLDFSDALPGVDALVTDEPNLLLTLFFADCLPVFFVSQNTRAIGIAHAGWRGIDSGVLENTVSVLTERTGEPPKNYYVAIGPGIGADAFIVGEEVAARFPESARWNVETRKWSVALASECTRRLTVAGIPVAQIDVSEECAFAESSLYFSHRRDKGRTGRMGAFIALSPTELR